MVELVATYKQWNEEDRERFVTVTGLIFIVSHFLIQSTLVIFTDSKYKTT